ncbi:MAG: prepilin-type N-terminal cleavage/methylation domain-containing protein [bacterium]|nr:prepilin-type N-terminal cleavage/methylation domain-containing protein [bacterium]
MDNKGISLIEVVVSLAILGIVVACVGTFLNVGMNTSTTATNIASVQKEAQIVQNQVQSWIMGTNKGIACYKDQTNFDYVAAIYHTGQNASDQYVQLIYYREKEQRLYYHKLMTDESTTGSLEDIINDANAIEAAADWESYLLSSFVTDINLDTTQIENQVVSFTIDYAVKGKTYHVSNTIKLRNVVSTNPTE